MDTSPSKDLGLADAIAASLVLARRRALALPGFPGPLPADLAQAYAIQRAGIDAWSEAIAGWKVGRLTPDLASRFGVERFVGPVFKSGVVHAPVGQRCDFRMFEGGSAAFEAELVVYAAESQPIDQARFEAADARRLAGEARIAIEVAGSPLASLPQLGSLATVAEFGNNNGQLMGPQVPLEVLDAPESFSCTTVIDGAPAVTGTLSALPGGAWGAFAFALEALKALGAPLRAGQFVSTGAITGVHPVELGQRCSADFGPWGRIDAAVVPQPPAPPCHPPAAGAAPCP